MDWQHVPDRESLLEQLQRSNQYTWLWVATRLAAIPGLAWLIQWDKVILAPIVSVTACLVIVGPFFMGLLLIWGQKKKRLEDIKESTRFGEFDKYRLQALFADTLQKLALPKTGVTVYVTNDKSLNASALRVGTLFGRLNGIYLNRQVLHKLRAEEIQAIMGHELGHYYRFNLAGDRFRLLTIILGAMVGVFAVQKIELDGFLGFIVLSVVSYVFWYISGLAMMRHGQAIEHLCDDFGAQVQGIAPSIVGLLKVGLDAERRYLLQLEVLARCADNPLLTPQEVLASIEKSLPYGHASESEMYESVRRELKNQSNKNQQFSISGFLKYAWEGDSDDEDYREELQDQAKQVNQIKRLDWESVLDDPEEIRFNEKQIERLVNLILASQGESLFRIPDTMQDDGVHPLTENRILYLWKNRNSSTSLLLGQNEV